MGRAGPEISPARLVVVEITPVLTGGRTTLALVLRAQAAVPVWAIRGRREHLEHELRDTQAGIERDRQPCHVRELERDLAGEAGIGQAGGRMHLKAETPERALAVEPGDEIVRQADALQRRAE